MTSLRRLWRLIDDPTLRRWLLARALGHASAAPSYKPHQPPYLANSTLPEAVPPTVFANELTVAAPLQPLSLALPGETLTVLPGREAALFARRFPDDETLLAVQRFAWLPLLGPAVDGAWVVALWREWRSRFSTPDDSWAWHPYTAAERAVNLLRFARHRGLPAPAAETRALLATHAAVIADRLEYFGEHNTGNHLANNGRGLFALGLELDLPAYAEMGATILLEEAKRIFLPSGVLREGSSHYHLLYTRNYVDAWLWARRHAHPALASLEFIAARALAVVPHLYLKGGLPLIGDISPDCPPDHLAIFGPNDDATKGWGATLDNDERAAFFMLKRSVAPVDSGALESDGWIRLTTDQWAALWHVPPAGWAPMPGHAHQDIGSFEAHWDVTPLFVDPGRGAYGDSGEAAAYASAAAHNALTIDGHEAYPANKPYYDDAFRRAVCGPPPQVQRQSSNIRITINGFSRIGRVDEVERQFQFEPNTLSIIDKIIGYGRHSVVRRLHTPWPARRAGNGIAISTPSGDFQIEADSPLSIGRGKRWTAYGVAEPSSIITASGRVELPARLQLRVQRF